MVVSPAAMVPVKVAGGTTQVGVEKLTTNTPSAVVSVNVKLIVVPQTKAGEVLNSKGTVLLALVPCGRFGYGEFGCSTVTPGVVVDNTAETLVAPAHPIFFKSTTRELHSFALMTVSPLPPDTVLELTLNFGETFKQVL